MPRPSHLLTVRSVELGSLDSAKPGANCVNNPLQSRNSHAKLQTTPRPSEINRHAAGTTSLTCFECDAKSISRLSDTTARNRCQPSPHATPTKRKEFPPEKVFQNQEESRRRQPAGLQTENTPCRKENPIMGDFSLRAARIQLGALIAALLIAIFIAIGITAGAFVLSFAVQRDLARQGTIPENLAWIFPVIVDSAIFGSTVAIVILSKLKMHRRDKYFYVAVAVAVVAISILGNAYHAFHSATVAQQAVAAGQSIGYTPLDPAVAAVIAVIPPVLVLAFTHGLGILIKATGIAYSDYKVEIDNAAAGMGMVATQSVVMRNETAGAVQHSLGVVETHHAPESAPHLSPSEQTRSSVDPESSNDEAAAHAELEWFIATSDLPDAVKETARRKLADPTLTWEMIAQTSDPPVATSTSWRRYEKFDTAARAAGFENPPLIDMRASDVHFTDQLVTTA